MCMAPEYEIINGYRPGSIGRIVELHADYYHNSWNFGLYFEAKVAGELAEFLKRYDRERDGIWLATINGRIEGSIALDGIHARDRGAHLRWFILSRDLRGRGAGRALMQRAVDFAQDRKYKKIYLWTFEGLDAARHLYEKAGFRLIEQQKGEQWGATVNEQYFERIN